MRAPVPPAVVVPVLLFVSLAHLSCANDDPALIPKMLPAGATVSLRNDVQPIFNANCAFSGCHAGSQIPSGLDLEPGQAYQNLVGPGGSGVPSTEAPGQVRVRPGHSDTSYIINKLTGTDASVGGPGTQMPLGGTPLPAATIQVIRDWIDQGSPDN